MKAFVGAVVKTAPQKSSIAIKICYNAIKSNDA